MKKKIALIITVLICLASLGVAYLNSVALPGRIKSLIINALQGNTGKKVSLEGLRFSIFKGLVLRNLSIFDSQETILKAKEVSCAFIIPSIFKKSIVVPALNLNSVEIYLRRRHDNTINIQDLFSPKHARAKEGGFNFFVSKIRIIDSVINFKDETFEQPFNINLDNLNLLMRLSLAGSVKFSLKSEIRNKPLIKINADGEYGFVSQELAVSVHIKDLAAESLSSYYRGLGISIVKGLIDSRIRLNYKQGSILLKAEVQSRELFAIKDKISLKLNANAAADIAYSLKDDKWQFSGTVFSLGSEISGIEQIGVINNIKGGVVFNNSGISAKRLLADVWGFPIQADIRLSDFNSPSISINASSRVDLGAAKKALTERFRFELPADISGEGTLSLEVKTVPASPGQPQVSGSLDVSNAILKLKENNSIFSNINGKFEFDLSQLKWSGLNFEYNKHICKTSGNLADFKSPQLQIKLLSDGLIIDSDFSIEDNLIKFSKFDADYLDSKVGLTGQINSDSFEAKLTGSFSVELKDLKSFNEKFAQPIKQLDSINPQGLVNGQFSIEGTLNNMKTLFLQAELGSPAITAYGLKAQSASLTYNQEKGIIDIPVLHLALYSGSIDLAAKMNLNSQNLPFWLTMDMQGVKLQELKLDTPVKDKNISGIIKAGAKINGFSNDLSKLSGNGNISISEGNLWQLNLFQGLGSVLLIKDFSNITFHEGACDFIVRDKYIFTDNLKLKSDITDLSGPLKIGFDNSIDASLNVQILDEMAPITGSFKDITTALMGQAGKFGVIRISGTLKEPKFKFKPAVTDIFKGIKDALFSN